MKSPEVEKCLLEIAKIRPTLTPQYQKVLDTAQALWLEMDEQSVAHPNDGHAVMAQTALSLLFYSLSIHPQSLLVVIATDAIINALNKISMAKQFPGLAEPIITGGANFPSHKTLQ
jgi:hypothetical protein